MRGGSCVDLRLLRALFHQDFAEDPAAYSARDHLCQKPQSRTRAAKGVIRCACLLDVKENTILLVRVRENDLWYLPGGTIEEGETEKEALIREIDEELNVQLDEPSIRFDRTVIGPALGREGDVELNCYRAQWFGEIEARAEISDMSYIAFDRPDKMAPAVRILAEELLAIKAKISEG